MADKQARQDTADIERMVEAQARGEQVSGVSVEKGASRNASLDTRTSKVTLFADAADGENLADASDGENLADAADGENLADAAEEV